MTEMVYDHEIELNGINYLVDIEVEGNFTDESFSHEFGIERAVGFELVGLIVTQVQDEKGIVTSPTIIKQIENSLDLDDFNHLCDFE
jgi:hypothetical protein